MNLLDEAIRLKTSRGVYRKTEATDEEIEALIAWFKGEVGSNHIANAAGIPTNRFSAWFRRVAGAAYRKGRIKLS